MTDPALAARFTNLPTVSLPDRLRLAASKGQVEKVRELLQAGANFEADQEGRTALHYAALNGHVDVCRLLIAEGCNLDAQDVLGYSALHRGCSKGHVHVTSLLLENGCALDQQDLHGNTAVHEAAWNGFSKSLELLVKANCNVFATNKSGFTAIHLAAQNGHNESSRVLLYAGCNTNVKNNYGDTPLHTAARYGHAGVTRILISAQCCANEQNKNGDTALHIAAALKRRKIANLLVAAGIDLSIRNKQNETAVDVARRKEHPEIILIITTRPKAKARQSCPEKRNLHVNLEDPVICVHDNPVTKPPEPKPEKERKFLFFKWKKKDKDKNLSSAQQQLNSQKVLTAPPISVGKRPVQGFFNQYVPKDGVQYYKDLAGNIKQGPVGYAPICQCVPVVKRLEKRVDEACENIYDHIDASHEILRNRIDQLDKRTAQQVFSIDKLTKERIDAERSACCGRINSRLKHERKDTEKKFSEYNRNVKSELQAWLESKTADEDCHLPHHHDDSGFYHRSVFFDIHHNENGRLFRSRSDETLSQSDYGVRHRKKDFFESRQAAMQQLKAWQVPACQERVQRRGVQNHLDSLSKDCMQRMTIEPGPSISRPQSHNLWSPSRLLRRTDGQIPEYSQHTAVPKRVPHSQPWQPTVEPIQGPTLKRPDISASTSHVYSGDQELFRQPSISNRRLVRSMYTSSVRFPSEQKQNLLEGGPPEINHMFGSGQGPRNSQPNTDKHINSQPSRPLINVSNYPSVRSLSLNQNATTTSLMCASPDMFTATTRARSQSQDRVLIDDVLTNESKTKYSHVNYPGITQSDRSRSYGDILHGQRPHHEQLLDNNGLHFLDTPSKQYSSDSERMYVNQPNKPRADPISLSPPYKNPPPYYSTRTLCTEKLNPSRELQTILSTSESALEKVKKEADLESRNTRTDALRINTIEKLNMQNQPHLNDATQNKEDSSSNPDSGYSSRICGGNQQNATLDLGHSSPGTPSSFSTDRRGPPLYEQKTSKQYFECVTAHLQNWYQRKMQESGLHSHYSGSAAASPPTTEYLKGSDV